MAAPGLAQDHLDPLDTYDLQSQGPASPWRVAKVSFKGFKAVQPGEAREVIESKPPGGVALRLGEPYDRLRVERDIRRLEQML